MEMGRGLCRRRARVLGAGGVPGRGWFVVRSSCSYISTLVLGGEGGVVVGVIGAWWNVGGYHYGIGMLGVLYRSQDVLPASTMVRSQAFLATRGSASK